MSLKKLTLIEMPERSPECLINEAGIPLLAPTLTRCMNIPPLPENNIDSLIQYFEELDYVVDVTYNTFTVFVLCKLKEYTPSQTIVSNEYTNQVNDLYTATTLFREGVHQLLPSKIWRIRRSQYATSELQCKRDMGYPISYCSLISDYCIGEKDYYLFMVDINYTT